MIVRIALVFAGIILTGVLLNVYYVVCAFFTVFLLGINSDTIFTIQYFICLAAGAATSFFVMRKAWPQNKAPKPEDTAPEQAK